MTQPYPLNASPFGPMLPDYWSGDHRAHIQIPVRKNMTIEEVQRELINELRFGFVCGSDEVGRGLNAHDHGDLETAEAWEVEAKKAIENDIQLKEPGTLLFQDLEEDDEDSCKDSCYLYVVFTKKD